MLILLDTDHVSVLQRQEQPAAVTLGAPLATVPEKDVAVCIVSFQEQARGLLAYLHRARKPGEILKGFTDLHELVRYYSLHPLLLFDQSALDEFLRLQQQRIRIGTNDLRIAAIAKANGVKLLSRNLRDFRQVPQLDVEDWTI